MITSFDKFWALYSCRSGHDRWVRSEQLRDLPVVVALRTYPIDTLVDTAPDTMRRCLPPLTEQLQDWLRELKARHATTLATTPTVRRHRTASWSEPHSLAYWNRSGRNGGLRRWG